MKVTVIKEGKTLPPEDLSTYKISKGSFWKRVTVAKRAELITLSKTDVLLEAQLLTLADSEYIDLKDEDLISGLAALTVAGVFDEAHMAKILAPAEPEELPGV